MSCILAIDDRPINRQFLVTLLGYGGHKVLEASDGEEALGIVRQSHPDLVITDIKMPKMDGYEFVDRLRQDPEHTATPVIFYTALFHEREARMVADSYGVTDIITKPSEPEEI
jgi:CheY-like chemotaxis protein